MLVSAILFLVGCLWPTGSPSRAGAGNFWWKLWSLCRSCFRRRCSDFICWLLSAPAARWDWWQSITGHTLAFTFTGLVIGSILYSLPFAVQPFAASFSSVDRKLLAASATLGASPLRTFFAS
jgi:hypothetical protein